MSRLLVFSISQTCAPRLTDAPFYNVRAINTPFLERKTPMVRFLGSILDKSSVDFKDENALSMSGSNNHLCPSDFLS